VAWFAEHDFFSLEDSPGFLLELQWDHGREARTHDFQPSLPIVVRS
jgi:hypothetical protein